MRVAGKQKGGSNIRDASNSGDAINSRDPRNISCNSTDVSNLGTPEKVERQYLTARRTTACNGDASNSLDASGVRAGTSLTARMPATLARARTPAREGTLAIAGLQAT